MARQDVIHAMAEFFTGGGEAGNMPTLPSPPLRSVPVASVSATYGYQAVYVGQPIATPLVSTPSLFLFLLNSRESRRVPGAAPGANKKFIQYTCGVKLAAILQGDPQTQSVGADALWTFYGWLDAIAQMIRGGPAGLNSAKQLVTPSYPTGGAVVEWGEISSTEVNYGVVETGVATTADFAIQCSEWVNA